MRSIAHSCGCLYIFFIYCFVTLDVCVIILLTLRFGWMLVLSLYKEDYLQFLALLVETSRAYAIPRFLVPGTGKSHQNTNAGKFDPERAIWNC